jgi:asparagine synthase (glutamine-hydrolysing)
MSDYKIKVNISSSKKPQDNWIYKKVASPFKKHNKKHDCSQYSDGIISTTFNCNQFNYFRGEINGKIYFSLGSITIEDKYQILDALNDKESSLESDVKIMLKFFLKFGSQGFETLNNNFMLIVYDYENNELFGIRDHRGLSNFFYLISKRSNTIIISGDFNSLLSERNEFVLDTKKLTNFLQLNDSCLESTFFKEIRRLPPAYSLNFSDSGSMITKYFSYRKNKTIDSDEGVLTKQMRQNILDATLSKSCLEQDKIGFLFSGGLDSSSLISIFHQFSDKRLFAYTAKFTNFNSETSHLINEDNFQDEILQGTNIVKRGFLGHNLSTLSNIDFYLDIIGQPFFFPNLYVPSESFQKAAQDGVKVVVNGNDGDSTVSHGYELLVELFTKFKWIELYKEISAISKLRKKSKRFIFKNAVLKQLKFKSSFFTSAYNRHMEVINSPIHCNALEVQGAMASYYDIEEVYPFYNKSLISFCLNVPPSLKLKNGYSRYILRSAMKGIVPDKVRLRTTKSNLGHSLVLNFCKEDKDIIEEALRKPHKNLIDLVDMSLLKTQWEELKGNPRKFATRSDIPSKLFAFIVVNRWLNLTKRKVKSF